MAKRCRQCKVLFKPFNSLAAVCSTQCAILFANSGEGKALVQKVKKAETRQRKKEFYKNDQSHWTKKLDTAFNAFFG